MASITAESTTWCGGRRSTALSRTPTIESMGFVRVVCPRWLCRCTPPRTLPSTAFLLGGQAMCNTQVSQHFPPALIPTSTSHQYFPPGLALLILSSA
jgi:hypothetical protein